MLLGCIGDDFTGSSDLANTLSKNGMRTVQYTGIPENDAAADVEAGVVSLKSRSILAADAINLSLKALAWLKKQDCQQFFFKYCSTFDSTAEGNIGQVTDALLEALGADYTIVCPAFPGTGRSIYQGHLFVKDTLLNESGMQNHPLTPMVDADIRRWLKPQTQYPVGHVSSVDVLQGAKIIRHSLEHQFEEGHRMIVVDAIRDEDLIDIGEACDGLSLVTGGSGVAQGLPENFRKKGLIGQASHRWRGETGACAILSGSCSIATRAQVKVHASTNPVFEIDTHKVMSGEQTAVDIANWFIAQEDLPLAYSSADPEVVAAIQNQYGKEAVASTLEILFANIAQLLVEGGVRRLITAGGETSGAVIEGLRLDTLEIGPEIDPGVPALRARENLVVALKSGNFGAADFFVKAARQLAKI